MSEGLSRMALIRASDRWHPIDLIGREVDTKDTVRIGAAVLAHFLLPCFAGDGTNMLASVLLC